MYMHDDTLGEVLVGIPTCNRPKMLTQCLESIADLDIPRGCSLRYVVVDNSPDGNAFSIVNSLNRSDLGIKFEYINETRKGISYARNAILDRARELDTRWVIMIDDDMTVPTDWLLQMDVAAHEQVSDVVKSHVRYIHHSDEHSWSFPKNSKGKWRTGADMATTNGVMFNNKLFGVDHFNLSFSHEFNLTSGEDRDYFKRAYRLGVYITHTPDAIAFEHVPANRLTFWYQVSRDFWQERINSYQDIRFDGYLKTWIRKLFKAFYLVPKGLIDVILCGVMIAFNRKRGRKHLLKGFKKFSKALGIVSGLISKGRFEPYQTVQGH